MFNVSFSAFARFCGPSDINVAAPVVVTPAVSGPGVRIPTESICGPLDIQTAAGRVRASTVAGSGVRIPEFCLFPQPQHDIDPVLCLTGSEFAFGFIRPEFEIGMVVEGCSGLDAPTYIPRGSVSGHTLLNMSWAMQCVSRP